MPLPLAVRSLLPRWVRAVARRVPRVPTRSLVATEGHATREVVTGYAGHVLEAIHARADAVQVTVAGHAAATQAVTREAVAREAAAQADRAVAELRTDLARVRAELAAATERAAAHTRAVVESQVGRVEAEVLQLRDGLRELAVQLAASVSGVIEESARLADAERARAAGQAIADVIRHAAPDAYLGCEFNGVPVVLPRDTLRTMVHCIHPRAGAPFRLLVETAHEKWLEEKLRPGDLFLDVGAATGAMTVPISAGRPGVRTVAFEPRRSAARTLRETLAKNHLDRVEVHEVAVADRSGTAPFAELGFDETGERPWQPEMSALANPGIAASTVVDQYDVPVVTLDEFFAGRPDAVGVRAVKIDVEGFEVKVLAGAARLLARARPFLAIDIHPDPFGPGDTERAVVAALDPLGYTYERVGHVLLCRPSPGRH